MAAALRKVRLRVPAGTAKPGPAIGQALGPLGLNMMEFCKAFNAETAAFIPNTPMQVTLTAFANRTFAFKVKSPPTAWLLKRCAGVEKGAARTVHETVGSVHVKHIYEIAKVKQRDHHLSHLPLRSICRMVHGTCGTMGIEVLGLRDPIAPLVKEGSGTNTPTTQAAFAKPTKPEAKK